MTDNDTDAFATIERDLHYQFSDPALLKLALKHKSTGKPNNERLEFLGDSILNAIVAEWLYTRSESAAEGSMTAARSQLVKGDTLSAIGRELGLEKKMELGRGERKQGQQVKSSILEDAVEALIGAVFLDGGFDVCKSFVLGLLDSRLTVVSKENKYKDAKTTLQEWTQAKKKSLPDYVLEATQGPAHRREFTVACQVDGIKQKTFGIAGSRRNAEQLAAADMLILIDRLHSEGSD